MNLLAEFKVRERTVVQYVGAAHDRLVFIVALLNLLIGEISLRHRNCKHVFGEKLLDLLLTFTRGFVGAWHNVYLEVLCLFCLLGIAFQHDVLVSPNADWIGEELRVYAVTKSGLNFVAAIC